jgi:DNA mismatch endonuclease (patch repair protein)
MTNSARRKGSTKPKGSKARLARQARAWCVGGSFDNMAPAHRRRTMASVRCRDTAPEILVRRLAHGLGFRFRVCQRGLRGCPDLVFPRLGRVIFVHGCFWHCHACKKGQSRPANNAVLWKTKLDRNKARDRAVVRQLRRAGWEVMVLWECQLNNLVEVEARVGAFLRGARNTGRKLGQRVARKSRSTKPRCTTAAGI